MTRRCPPRPRCARPRFTPQVEALEARDTPTAAVRVSLATRPITTEDGGAAAVQFVLTQRPAANVAFSVGTSDATEGRASVRAVTFTPANWNRPQVVRVVGQAD